uniref:Uncharacterized protein n=1 Tax=Amphimedon queenslandica TaxID=400682 RepID=A0A1X7SK14_AMPQE
MVTLIMFAREQRPIGSRAEHCPLSSVRNITAQTERKLFEKDNEINSLRKTHQRQLAALQQLLEEENKAKNDTSSTDLNKLVKKLQAQVKDLNRRIDEETRHKDEQHQLAATCQHPHC